MNEVSGSIWDLAHFGVAVLFWGVLAGVMLATKPARRGNAQEPRPGAGEA